MRVTNAKPKPWTREELKEFIELYPHTDTEVLMRKFNRTKGALICKAARLVLSKTAEYNARRGRETQARVFGKNQFIRKWSAEDIAQLAAEYPDTDNLILSERYKRSVRAIIAAAKKHGIKKSRGYMKILVSRKSKLGVEARWGAQ